MMTQGVRGDTSWILVKRNSHDTFFSFFFPSPFFFCSKARMIDDSTTICRISFVTDFSPLIRSYFAYILVVFGCRRLCDFISAMSVTSRLPRDLYNLIGLFTTFILSRISFFFPYHFSKLNVLSFFGFSSRI